MYMENFEFEGSFFGLSMEKAKLQTKGKKYYKVEGGYEGIKETNLDEIVAEFLSALFTMEIVDPASMSRATETSSIVDMARRGIYYVTKNAFSDMYHKMIERSDNFFLDASEILDS